VKNQLKFGAIVSYTNIILNMVFTVFLTPFLISGLGESEYGVYKIIQSFTGQLTIVSFGIATLIIRNIVFYNTIKKQDEKENFLFFAIVFTFFVSILIFVLGVVLIPVFTSIYSNSLTPSELSLGKALFILMVTNLSLSIISDSFVGIITAHENFVASNGINTVKLILRFSLIILLMNFSFSSVFIVLIDCSLSLLSIIFAFYYGRYRLNEVPKFHKMDLSLFKLNFIFAFAIFLQTIISQVNQGLDNTILGIMTDSKTVTMYSIGLSIFTIYISLVTAIRGLFTPSATKLIALNPDSDQITDFVVKPGRFQLIVAGITITGFILFGKNFITLWVGESYINAYHVSVILLLSSVIPLIETTTVSILDAMMKRLGRSMILVLMSLINIAVSVFLIQKIGYIGAAIGTSLSYIIGDGILLNLYLHKTIKLRVIKMFKEIFNGLGLSIIVSFVFGMPLVYLPDSLFWFIVKVCVYSVIYISVIYFVGINKDEKKVIRNMIKGGGSIENF
jgi:O-antigen/teichoic acid export membrane protein